MRIPKKYAFMTEEEYRLFRERLKKRDAEVRAFFDLPETQERIRQMFGDNPPWRKRAKKTVQEPILRCAKELIENKQAYEKMLAKGVNREELDASIAWLKNVVNEYE